VFTTNLSQCRCVHHKSVPVPLCSPRICPSAAVFTSILTISAVFTTNLSQCRCVHHKSVPVPLCSPQICPSAAVFTTNLSQCRCVHLNSYHFRCVQHESVPMTLCSLQICPSAAVFTTNFAQTGLGSSPSLRSERRTTDRLQIAAYNTVWHPKFGEFLDSQGTVMLCHVAKHNCRPSGHGPTQQHALCVP